MDELLKTLVTGAPNLIIAIWVIGWMHRRIEARDRLLFDLLRQCYDLPDDPTGQKE